MTLDWIEYHEKHCGNIIDLPDYLQFDTYYEPSRMHDKKYAINSHTGEVLGIVGSNFHCGSHQAFTNSFAQPLFDKLSDDDVKNFWTRLFIKKFALTIKFNVKILRELHHQFQSNKLRALLRGKVNALTNLINKIRTEIPDHFLLIPGIGAQGGDLIEVCKHALNDNIGIIVNSSRSIIYASTDDDFATAAANQAMILQAQMSAILSERK